MTTQTTQLDRVETLLGSRRWIPVSQINEVAGSEHGTRRARELRTKRGWKLKTRRIGSETQYRVIDKG